MLTSEGLQSEKKEVTLEINSFDKPKELSQVEAWSQLLLNLIFMRPGTYPSMPNMGVGIENYQFEFLEDAIEELTTAISEQQKIYLSDIPLNGINCTQVEHNGTPVLLIQFVFNVEDQLKTSAIAINTTSRNFLDFEISW